MSVRHLVHRAAPPRQGNVGVPDGTGQVWRLGTVLTLRRGSGLDVLAAPSEYVHGVLVGTLRACRPLVDGRRQITAFLFPGDWYGLDKREGHRTMVEAVTGARVARFPRRALETPGQEIGGALEKALRASLEAALARVVVLGQKSARDKLAAFLLDLADRLAQGGPEFRLPMSRYDIADYLGLRPETVCRTFTQLAAAGAIALPEPQHVRVLDRDALAAMGGWP